MYDDNYRRPVRSRGKFIPVVRFITGMVALAWGIFLCYITFLS